MPARVGPSPVRRARVSGPSDTRPPVRRAPSRTLPRLPRRVAAERDGLALARAEDDLRAPDPLHLGVLAAVVVLHLEERRVVAVVQRQVHVVAVVGERHRERLVHGGGDRVVLGAAHGHVWQQARRHQRLGQELDDAADDALLACGLGRERHLLQRQEAPGVRLAGRHTQVEARAHADGLVRVQAVLVGVVERQDLKGDRRRRRGDGRDGRGARHQEGVPLQGQPPRPRRVLKADHVAEAERRHGAGQVRAGAG